jgi:putative peptidoglycan lipid II flippase
MVTNVILNLALMGPLAHVGIALATTIAAWLNCGLLYWVLYRRGLLAADARLVARLPRTLAATAVMTAALWAGLAYGQPYLDNDFAGRALGLAVLIVGGLLLYAGTAQVTGAARLSEIKRLMRRVPAETPPA